MAGNRAKIVRSTTVFKGTVFDVRRDEIVEPDGLRATRDIITHSGSVVVMPVFPNGDVLLVRQFRYAAGEYLWELVAGSKEPNESARAGARRELLEETGYKARRIRLLVEVIPTPGFLTETMAIFSAEGIETGTAATGSRRAHRGAALFAIGSAQHDPARIGARCEDHRRNSLLSSLRGGAERIALSAAAQAASRATHFNSALFLKRARSWNTMPCKRAVGHLAARTWSA
jgi:8-oxo-dGTP pyrophosphatase MutT (NUDIX family)